MANHARLDGAGTVIETADDAALATHIPALRAEFVGCPDDVRAGWRKVGSDWVAPAAPEPEPDAPAGDLEPTPPHFMAAMFTFQERVAIRAARETDPAVDDFLTLLEDPRLDKVPLSAPYVQGAIAYLGTTTPPLLTAERVAQVQAGLPAPLPA